MYARLKGVTEFEAFVLADNFGMMRLFRSSGYKVVPSLEEDVYRIEFPTEYSLEARAALPVTGRTLGVGGAWVPPGKPP